MPKWMTVKEVAAEVEGLKALVAEVKDLKAEVKAIKARLEAQFGEWKEGAVQT